MKIAVIGAGAMGGATVEGLIKGQQFKNEDITVSDPSQAVVEKFAKTGVSVTTDNKLAADSADIVCVVVKPWLVERVLKDIKPELDPKKQILIVIAAGVSSESIKQWLGESCPPLFLAIPNIAIAEMASMTFIVPIDATEDKIQTVVNIFDEMGNTLITDEQHLAAPLQRLRLVQLVAQEDLRVILRDHHRVRAAGHLLPRWQHGQPVGRRRGHVLP